MKIVAIVQARMGSTRLPGKVLADLGGRPALARVLERAAKIDGVDAVVLAIPDGREDDVLEAIAGECGVGVVRGERDDVLARYQVAAAASAADAIVRITADCPILDPAISSSVVHAFVDERADYASNTRPPTFPDGYDTEVVSRDALDIAFVEARDPFEREHVLPFVWRRPERFALTNVIGGVDRSSWRLTLDTAEDLGRLRRVWAALGHQPMFGLAEVAALAEREPGILS